MRCKEQVIEGFSVFDPDEEAIHMLNCLMNAEEEYYKKVNFYKQYEKLTGNYPELEFTEKEKEEKQKFFDVNGRIAVKMNHNEDITLDMIIHELHHCVKGYDIEKQKLAKIIHAEYLVGQKTGFPNANCVIDDVILNTQTDKLPDALKHALIEMLMW